MENIIPDGAVVCRIAANGRHPGLKTSLVSISPRKGIKYLSIGPSFVSDDVAEAMAFAAHLADLIGEEEFYFEDVRSNPGHIKRVRLT